MNKKLGRLLRPNMGWYITVMLLFALAAAVFGDYLLAGLELLVTAGVFVLYMTNRNRRKKLLTLSIVEVALIPVAVVLILVWVFGLAALGITGGNLSEEAMGVSVIVLILLFMVMLLPFIALAVIAVILQIQKCCAYWDLFGSCVPQKRKLFSALSIVASCIGIDLVAAILIFACRNKEEGMPPRMEV